jgi:uncharacterized protein (DUF697 family)
MPRLPFAPPALKAAPGQVGGAMRLWSLFKSLNIQDIAEAAERPFQLALIGTEDHAHLLTARLALESAAPRDLGPQGPADVRPYVAYHASRDAAPPGSLLLDADALTADEARLAGALAQTVVAHPDLRLALARHVPAFRPAVVACLIGEASRDNAKIALVSALPGIVPFTAFLLPATALGDMVLLTKNQVLLLLRIAAAYGKDMDLRARTRELLPVVGSAFGWRAAARELIGLVPGGIGLLVKGCIAYAGTYTVGKSAAVYYSTGHTLSPSRLRQLYNNAFRDAVARVRPLLRRGKTRPTVDKPAEARV